MQRHTSQRKQPRAYQGEHYVSRIGHLGVSEEILRETELLTYTTVFAMCLCGYAHAPVWTIVLGTLGLTALTYAKHYRLLKRGTDLGLFDLVDGTVASASFTALLAASVSYVIGIAVRSISGI